MIVSTQTWFQPAFFGAGIVRHRFAEWRGVSKERLSGFVPQSWGCTECQNWGPAERRPAAPCSVKAVWPVVILSLAFGGVLIFCHCGQKLLAELQPSGSQETE